MVWCRVTPRRANGIHVVSVRHAAETANPQDVESRVVWFCGLVARQSSPLSLEVAAGKERVSSCDVDNADDWCQGVGRTACARVSFSPTVETERLKPSSRRSAFLPSGHTNTLLKSIVHFQCGAFFDENAIYRARLLARKVSRKTRVTIVCANNHQAQRRDYVTMICRGA